MGVKSGVLDADYQAAGADIGSGVTSNADIVLKVRWPTKAELSSYKPRALVISIMDPYGNIVFVVFVAKPNNWS